MRFFTIFMCLFPALLMSQNLVVNPGFEDINALDDYRRCRYSDGTRDFNRLVKDWNGFRGQTPDIIIAPDSNCVYPAPVEGRSMVGLITYLPAADRGLEKDFREMVQGQLSEPMKVDQVYHVQFWVSQSKKVADHHLRDVFWTDIKTVPLATNNLGILFLDYPFQSGIDIEKSLSDLEMYPNFNVEEVIETEEGIWKKYSGTIRARNAYTHFMIGNFYRTYYTQTNLSDSEMEAIDHHNQNVEYEYNMKRRIAYYLIDDIYVGLTPPPSDATKAIANLLKTAKAYTFEAVHFESGKSDLLPSSFPELDALAIFLSENTSLRVEIGGHTDSVGSEAANQHLSEARAKSVCDYLLSKGIANQQLTYKGYGESLAKASNKTPEGRRLNRRVECKVLE
ncbi:MAG: OmpA family protein [Saprospiraceae bacterium]|nr:OmpA family protein [Saprospiraceae bacterium]